MGNLSIAVNTYWLRGRRKRQCYMRNWIRKKSYRKGINIMWKFGGRIRKRLNIKINYSLRN